MVMNENKLRKIALDLIGICQNDININADKGEFIYSMAYNDGVIAFLEALLKEQTESEG